HGPRHQYRADTLLPGPGDPALVVHRAQAPREPGPLDVSAGPRAHLAAELRDTRV
ncbi:hypothetical protein EV182_005615, partial [Spiromyces aspiralis]